jgi:hypothetical protein
MCKHLFKVLESEYSSVVSQDRMILITIAFNIRRSKNILSTLTFAASATLPLP